MENKKLKVAFPHLGNYWIGFKEIALMLDAEIVMPPSITRKTIEIGSKNSPDTACVPYKYTMGNFLEALEMGANVLIQAGGTSCRYAFYGEVQEVALRKLGYDFVLLKFSKDKIKMLKLFLEFKRINPKLTYLRIIKSFFLAYDKFEAIEVIEDIIRKNIGFEINQGSFENLFKKFLIELDSVHHTNLIKKVREKYINEFNEIPVDKPKNPLKVGVIGEFYVTMEPFSNFFIEKELGKRGVEVYRFVTITHELKKVLFKNRIIKEHLKMADNYLKYHIGAHGTETVGMALHLIKEGFDGLIHIKPFGCVPETSAMTMLHRISKDYKVPVLYFSFDAQTSETGIKTRIEAFYDMLKMKKNKKYGSK